MSNKMKLFYELNFPTECKNARDGIQTHGPLTWIVNVLPIQLSPTTTEEGENFPHIILLAIPSNNWKGGGSFIHITLLTIASDNLGGKFHSYHLTDSSIRQSWVQISLISSY